MEAFVWLESFNFKTASHFKPIDIQVFALYSIGEKEEIIASGVGRKINFCHM